MTRAVVWFRNDLRVRDNPCLLFEEVRSAKELIALYCFDPRHMERSPWADHARTGPFRDRFTRESLVELDRSLREIGSKLLVLRGRPEDCVPALLPPSGVLAFQQEDT